MGKKIDQLDVYDDVNTDKSRKNLFEVSKNTGTYSSPFYDTDGSRKITQEQLREELNIKEYLVNEVIGKTNGDTLEVDKINVLNLTSNATFTLPTASIAYKGKALIIIQSNVNNYKAVINGAAQGPITISDFRDVIIFNCVFNETSTYDWFAISKDDSKICNRLVVISSSTYTANANDNIQANAQSLGSDIDITIPAAGIEGRLIYVYYPSGSPSAYVVNLIGGFSATLEQLDYFLIRDNGSYWEAISTSQNVSTTPSLDEVTDVGNTTQNSIEVGGLVVDMPSGSGAATSITKGGAGEALTVSKTSGSGNVASFTGGVTSIQEAEITSATANRPAFFDSAKKLVIATGALLGTWFQTLNAKSTPIGADTIVVNDSAASFEAKKTTLLQLWTNYLRAFVFSTTLTTNRVPKANASGILTDSNITDNGTGVGINTPSIDASAAFQVDSTTKGVLFPRMNTTQINAIVSPAQSLLVFDITLNRYFYRHGGGYWQPVGDVDTTTQQIISGNKTFQSLSIDWADLGSSLPNLTGGNARYTSLRSNNASVLSLYSNLGGGVYVTMNSQVGTSWHRQHASGTFLTYPCGTQIGNGTAPIYSSVNPTTGAAYEITITPDTGGSLGSMYCIAIVDANNIVTNLIKVKPSLNPSSYDLNLVSNKLQTSGSNSSNVVFRGITGARGGQTNLAQAFWRYSADLSSAAIGGSEPNARSQLHLQSTSKGFLPNVLTTAQRDAVSWVAGDAGMIIYNSTTNKHQGWNGTTWNDMY